jgi:hexokinase
MPASRRGSGTLTLPSGQTLTYHTRTHDEEGLPHATKKCVQPLFGDPIDSTDIAQDYGRSPPSSREPVRLIGFLIRYQRGHANAIHRFTLTPQRMRMIVEAFKDALETGLEKHEQVVVRLDSIPIPLFNNV